MAGSEAPLYDRNAAIAQLDGDAGLFAEIATVFVAESETYCRALEAALVSGNAVELRREAHTLKSMLATFAYETARARAQQLEHLAAAGDFAGVPARVAELTSAIRGLAVALVHDSA